MVIDELQHGLGRILLIPNQSATWQTNKWLIAALGTFTLFVATVWTLIGAWMVLPFAGLEVGLLAFFLHKVSRSTYRREVLHVEAEQLRIESGIEFPSRRWQFSRDRSHIRVVSPPHELSGHNIFLCGAEARIELGAFLNPEDKLKLIDVLGGTNLVIKRIAAGGPRFQA